MDTKDKLFITENREEVAILGLVEDNQAIVMDMDGNTFTVNVNSLAPAP